MANHHQSHTKTEVLWRRLYLSRAKLKAVSRTSALLSGFAMVAMVEIHIEENPPTTLTSASRAEEITNNGIFKDGGSGNGGGSGTGNGSSLTKVPQALLIVYVTCTTLLVTVHLISLMISTCILPNMEAVSEEVSRQAVNESPHETMKHYVETAWICSTGIGILLFMVEIALLAWVKFYTLSPGAALASSAVAVPAALLFLVFSLLFYRRLMAHKHERHEVELKELEVMTHDLNRHSVYRPTPPPQRRHHQLQQQEDSDRLCVHLV